MTENPEVNSLFSRIASGNIPLPPSSVLLGLKIERAAQGEVNLSMRAASSFLNPAGHVQGGMLAAMLDEATAIATLTTLAQGEFVVTLEMKVQFLNPALEGGLEAKGRVIHRTRRIAFAEAEISQQGKLSARATATLMIKGIKH